MDGCCLKMMILLGVTLSTISAAPTTGSKKGMSMDKRIIDAAPDARMFDVFHVMPGGQVMVMTELDLLLTLDQYKDLHGKERLGDDRFQQLYRGKRKADRNTTLYWPGCKVYFEIVDFNLEDQKAVNEAIAEWEKYTCLDFIESSSEESRIQFKNGGGCYSALGRQPKPQPIALAPSCRTVGIITHEIGHAIGWYHEHMRPDRDKYIGVNEDAIPTRYRINFQKYTSEKINSYSVEYDYTSLMHYGNDALPGSITTLDPDYQESIGQRDGLSFKDIKLANLMYNCAAVMGCSEKECPYNGFQFYKDYKGKGRCQCWCNSGDIAGPLVLCSELTSEPKKPVIRPTETPVIDLCYDVRNDCELKKVSGECMSQMGLMMDACKKTCGFCGPDSEDGSPPPEPCMDHDKGCEMMAMTGMCETLEPVMEKQCPASCNKCPSPPDPCKIQQEVMALADIPLSGSHNGGQKVLALSGFGNLLALLSAVLLTAVAPTLSCV